MDYKNSLRKRNDGHLKGKQSQENIFIKEKVIIFAGPMERN